MHMCYGPNALFLKLNFLCEGKETDLHNFFGYRSDEVEMVNLK